MPWQPKRPTISCGASGTALLAGQALLCSALCAVLGTTIQEGLQTITGCPKKAYKAGEGFSGQDV